MLDPVVLAGGKILVNHTLCSSYISHIANRSKFRGPIGNRETFPVKHPVQ